MWQELHSGDDTLTSSVTATSLVVMAGEAIIHRWHAATGVHSSSFQTEKTVMEKAISWLEANGDWRKALLICDCKSLVDGVGNSHAPDEGIRLVGSSSAAQS